MSNFKIYEKGKNKWTEVPIVPAPHGHEFLTSGDTRDVNSSPSNYKKQLTATGLKRNNIVGLPSAEGSYSSLIGYGGWTDSSGGAIHELAFGGNGGLYHRYGTTAWTNWNKIATENWVKNEISKNKIDLTPYLKRDGSTPMTGNLDMNGHEINDITALHLGGGKYVFGAEADHLVVGIEEQVYCAYKDRIDLANSKITNLANPTSQKDAVNRQWVEDYVANNSGGGSGEWTTLKLINQSAGGSNTPDYNSDKTHEIFRQSGSETLKYSEFRVEMYFGGLSGLGYNHTFHFTKKALDAFQERKALGYSDFFYSKLVLSNDWNAVESRVGVKINVSLDSDYTIKISMSPDNDNIDREFFLLVEAR